MGLMEEIFHHVVEIYRQTVNPQIHQQLEAYLLSTMGSVALESSLAAFLEEFPPTQIAQKHQTIAEYLAGVSEGLTNRQIAIQEMLMLWLANKNPALEIYRDFMADDGLMSESAYPSIIKLRLISSSYNPRSAPKIKTWSKCCAARPSSFPTRFPDSWNISAPTGVTCLEPFFSVFLSAWTYCAKNKKPEDWAVRVPSHSGIRRPHGGHVGSRTVQPGQRLDAAAGSSGEKHLRMVGSAEPGIRPQDQPSG